MCVIDEKHIINTILLIYNKGLSYINILAHLPFSFIISIKKVFNVTMMTTFIMSWTLLQWLLWHVHVSF